MITTPKKVYCQHSNLNSALDTLLAHPLPLLLLEVPIWLLCLYWCWGLMDSDCHLWLIITCGQQMTLSAMWCLNTCLSTVRARTDLPVSKLFHCSPEWMKRSVLLTQNTISCSSDSSMWKKIAFCCRSKREEQSRTALFIHFFLPLIFIILKMHSRRHGLPPLKMDSASLSVPVCVVTAQCEEGLRHVQPFIVCVCLSVLWVCVIVLYSVCFCLFAGC